MSVVLATGDPVGTEGVVAISNLERQLGFLARIAVDSVKAAVLRKAPGYTLKYFCDRSPVEKTMVWCHQRRCSRRLWQRIILQELEWTISRTWPLLCPEV